MAKGIQSAIQPSAVRPLHTVPLANHCLNHTLKRWKGVSAGFHKDLQTCSDLAPWGGSPVCCFSQMNRQMFGECGALESLNSHTHSLLQYRLHILKCSETSTTHTLQFTSVVIFSPLHFLTAMFAISMFYAPLVFIVSNFAIFVCTAVF